MRTIVKGKNIDVPDHIRRVRRAQARAGSSGSSTTAAMPSSSSPSSGIEALRTRTSSRSRSSSTGRRCGPTRRPNHRAGVDEVVDKVERRAVDHHEKPRLRARPAEEKAILRRIADGTAETRSRTADRQDEAVRDRADVRGGRASPGWRSSATSSSSSSTPRPSASDPLPPRRRRLRGDRAGRRRRVHEGSRPRRRSVARRAGDHATATP